MNGLHPKLITVQKKIANLGREINLACLSLQLPSIPPRCTVQIFF